MKTPEENDPERDSLIKEAATAIQEATVPTLVKIHKT